MSFLITVPTSSLNPKYALLEYTLLFYLKTDKRQKNLQKEHIVLFEFLNNKKYSLDELQHLSGFL